MALFKPANEDAGVVTAETEGVTQGHANTTVPGGAGAIVKIATLTGMVQIDGGWNDPARDGQCRHDERKHQQFAQERKRIETESQERLARLHQPDAQHHAQQQ